MIKKALRLDEIGYWSEVKLDVVRKYATAYSTIMAKQASIKRHIYIDAFAGGGEARLEDDGRFRAWQPAERLTGKSAVPGTAPH